MTKAQWAHWELHSLKCSWGREARSTPQDLPSPGMPPADLAFCATPPVTRGVSQGAPQTTRPMHPSGVQSWDGGSRRSPDPPDPQQPCGRAHLLLGLGALGTHNPYPTRPQENHSPLEKNRPNVCSSPVHPSVKPIWLLVPPMLFLRSFLCPPPILKSVLAPVSSLWSS